MLPGLEFRTCDRSFSRRSSGTRAPPRMRCKIVKGFRKAEGVDSLMEFWFSFHRKHRSPPSRRTKSPRATFPSTINALLCPGVEDDERIHLVLDFTSRGETAVSFPARSTLIEFQAARGTPGPHRRPSLSSVKLGSYPAWSLGITPTDVVVCRLVARTASPSSSTDPKKERRRSSVACATPAREPTDENSTFLSLGRCGWFLVACVRVCVGVAETTT